MARLDVIVPPAFLSAPDKDVSPVPPTRPPQRSSGYRWLVFGLLAGAYFMVYFHRTSPAVVALDLMRDLKAGGGLIGLLASAYFYPYALMQLPAGLLSDSWGPRRTITVFFALAGLGSILFGLVGSVSWAIVARVLVGLGVSMVFVPTMKALTLWFRRDQFASMMGVLMAVGGLGVLGAATPLAYLSSLLGWRGSFVAIGCGTLVITLAIWLLVRDRPQDLGLPPVEEAPAREAGQAAGVWQGARLILSSRSFWPLAMWFLFEPAFFFAFAGLWGGPYLMHVYGLSKAQAGGVLSMIAVGMIFGSPLQSYLSDHLLRSRKKPLVLATLVVLLISSVLAFFPAGLNLGLLYLLFLLLGLFAGAVPVVAFASAKELFPLAAAGTATGLVNLMAFLGPALTQVLIGLVLEAQGKVNGVYPPAAYGRAFLIFFGCAVAALLASLSLKESFGLGTAAD